MAVQFLYAVTLPFARGFGEEASPNRSRPLPLNQRLSQRGGGLELPPAIWERRDI